MPDDVNASAFSRKLRHPPIVEAVVDTECDLPSGRDLPALEGPARKAFQDSYPELKKQVIHEQEIRAKADAEPEVSLRHGLSAYQFVQAGARQLVQVRRLGFSFNRLAPYSSLDEYLPEIKRCWTLYRSFAAPTRVRLVRLRYINRVLLPMTQGEIDLGRYFRSAPRMPSIEGLALGGFVHQYAVEEKLTGNRANLILASQRLEGNSLPIILDNGVEAAESGEPEDWSWMLGVINQLRVLKNDIFFGSVTAECLKLFQ